MNLFRAEELRYPQVRAFSRERAICFLPVSALEVHGEHLPVGMDMFMARCMAEETARRFAEAHPDWDVVLYPPLTIGTDELPLPGSMNVTQRTLYRALTELGASFAHAGYGYVVVTNGHGGARHASGLEAACRHVSRRHGIAMFTPAIVVLHAIVSGNRCDRLEAILGRPLTDEEQTSIGGGEHAAIWETSFELAERGELVDPMYRQLGPDGPPPFRPLAMLGQPLLWLVRQHSEPEKAAKLGEMMNSLAGGIGWVLNARFGYGGHQVTYDGNPSVASAELGHAFRQLVAEDCLAVVESVVRGERTAEEVRSIASDPILIHPLFWRRLALGMGGALALALVLSLYRPRRK
ncbi:MAG: creatininase family protein [Candidatus Bathyarchaeota archaeon]|nr:creatininase family protein [Candidatus Bathyarchaeota archaeon]